MCLWALVKIICAHKGFPLRSYRKSRIFPASLTRLTCVLRGIVKRFSNQLSRFL